MKKQMKAKIKMKLKAARRGTRNVTSRKVVGDSDFFSL